MITKVSSRYVLGAVVVWVGLFGAIAHAATAFDFADDVRRLSHAPQPSDILVARSTIQTADHVTSWDEFGSNVLVDGTNAPADVHTSITNDIADDLQKQLAYDQEEQQYLQLRHSSPEEVVALEGDGGNDLPPGANVEPNPSIDANPEVDPSIPETSIENIATMDATNTPDDLVPPDGGWSPDALHVFQAIVDAGTSTADTPGTSTPAVDQGTASGTSGQSEPNQNTDSAPSSSSDTNAVAPDVTTENN